MIGRLLKAAFIYGALLLPFFAYASLSFSRTLFIEDAPYYIPKESLTSFSGSISYDILPIALFTTNSSTVTGESLKSTVESWKIVDDVFSESFMQGTLIVNKGTSKATLSSTALSYLASVGVTNLFVSDFTAVSSGNLSTTSVSGIDLPAGPYVIAKDAYGEFAIFKPSKLYFDQTQSFFKSVHPSKNGSFSVVSASLDTDSSPYVGVPSRIYAESADKSISPLTGVRVTVKDIYFLKGIKASCGNRAFYEVYPARNATGPAVRRLLDTGADIVGTTKTVQFANGDRATADWVDYHAPFVVRGDGYHEPSGSSTGAGASTAAHDWLDVAIGSDTGGSIRLPAGVNGIYGMRPSVGAIDLTDVMPLSDVLDTGGFLTRDPHLFRAFGKTWYGQNPNFTSYPSFPKNLLVSSSFATVSEAAATIYSDFISKVAHLLGATTQNITLAELWNSTSGESTPITTKFNETYPTLIAFHQWNAVGQPLFEAYAAANGGRNPHINPSVLERWQYGIAKGQAGCDAELANRTIFEEWALPNIFGSSNSTCSEAIYLYPQNAGTYDSRELYLSAPSPPPFGFGDSRIAVYSRSPDIVIPIGQIPFHSTITGVEEMLPVSISLVAHRNCDFMLLDLVGKLADAGIAKAVKTGRTAF